MLPTDFNWLAGPWNVRSMKALQKWGQVKVRAICPIGLTPPEEIIGHFPPDAVAIWKWLQVRLSAATVGQIETIHVSYPKWFWLPKRLFWRYEGRQMYYQLRRYFSNVVKEFRPDVIHAPWLNPEGVAACLLGADHKIPCVVQGIGNDVNYYPYRYPGREVVIQDLQQASVLLFNCQSTRRVASSAGFRHKNEAVIYHGVDVEIFTPDPAYQKGAKQKIVTVANMIPRKNHQLLLEAFVRLPSVFQKSTSLEFVGDGPTRSELEQKVKNLGIQDSVYFAGQPSHVELVGYLQRAALFCLPSLSEGLPVAIIEAMACGLPVVASDVDGIPEAVVNDISGVLVPSDDVNALANALVYALSRTWDRLAIRDIVLSKFTWQRYADKMMALYESIC